jgi:signal peptidase I
MATEPKEKIRNVETTKSGKSEPGKWEWVKSISIAIFIALCFRWPVAEPFKIPSGSMEPTLHGDPRLLHGDRIFVNKHAYGIRYPFNGFRFPFTQHTIWYTDKFLWEGPDPERWDIVVFKSNEGPNVQHDTLVKRVVGLPGERIHIQNGKVYADGKELKLPDDMPDVEYTFEPYSNGFGLLLDDEHSLIPEGHFLMMGDNSSHSRDGRWFGWMPKYHMLGEVTSIWWPVSRWDDFTGYTKSVWWIGFWVLTGLYTLARLTVGRSWRVDSGSIGSAVRNGEHMLIRYVLGIRVPFTSRHLTKGRPLRRGELVLYKIPGAAKGEWEGLVGVVAGLPGDRVFLDDGALTVNDQPVGGDLGSLRFAKDGKDDKYGRSKGKEFSLVPDGHVYVLNEEGGADLDSRSLGWISLERVLGAATHVWWPIRRARKVKPLT